VHLVPSLVCLCLSYEEHAKATGRWHSSVQWLHSKISTHFMFLPSTYSFRALIFWQLLHVAHLFHYLRYTPLDVVFSLNVSMLILLGVTFRVLAFVSLVAFNRDKRGLPTLAQMSLYWIVNPLDDWARARGEQQELRSRRARIQSRNASSAVGPRSRASTGGDSSHEDSGRRSGSHSGEGDLLVAGISAHNSSDDLLRINGHNNARSQRTDSGYAAPASSGYDIYPELDYQAASEEL